MAEPVVAAVVVLAALVGLSADPAAGQSASWTTQLLVPPFASSFVSEWERNPQNLTLGVTYLGTAPAEYRIEGTLTGASRGTVARATSPFFTVEAGPVTDLYTGDDLLDWDVRVLEATAEDAWRSGVIPDDDYEICVRLVTPGDIQLNESCANFLVELPEAPQLLFPADGDGVSVFQPTFQWTPVVLREQLGIEYQVTIVERYPGQNPVVAVDANLPVFEETVGEAPLLVYPIDAIPLEPGREYVWQVEVLDGFGDPLVPEGLFSPPQRFTTAETDAFGRRLTPEGGLPETLPLVPALATLTDLAGVEVEPTPDGWLLNGQAWMDLDGPYGVRGRVRLEDLLLDDYGGFLSPTEGRVVARLESSLTTADASPVSVNDLVFTPDQGLLARATLRLPDGSERQLDGELQVTLGGLFGTVRTGGSGPVWRGGADPVEVAVSSVEVAFPGATTRATGALRLFGGVALCRDVAASVSADGRWTVDPLCVPGTSGTAEADVSAGELGFSPAPELSAGVRVSSATGPVTVNLMDGSVTYDVRAAARVEVVPGSTACAVRFDLRAASGGPVGVEGLDPRCDALRSRLDAGWLTLGFANLEVGDLSYQPGDGFRMAITVDGDPALPGLPDLQLPRLPDMVISEGGIAVPTASLPVVQEDVDLGGFGLDVRSLTVAAVQLAWDAWKDSDLSELVSSFDATLSFPGFPAAAPGCLSLAPPRVTGGEIREGLLTLQVGDADGLTADCTMEVAPGLEFNVQGYAGPVTAALGTALAPALEVTRGLGVEGTFTLEDPFICDATDELALSAALELSPDGSLSGTAPALSAPCPLRVAGLEIHLTEGTVAVDTTVTPTQVRATAGVEVRRADGGNGTGGTYDVAEGQLVVDLASGEILDGRASIPGPVTMGLPADEPIFVFQVRDVVVDTAGAGADGAQTLRFPGGGDATLRFESVRFGAEDGRIRLGAIVFESDFALEAGLDQAGAPTWRAISPDAPLGVNPGFRIDVPREVSLNNTGLFVDGQADATLVYQGRSFGQDLDPALASAVGEGGDGSTSEDTNPVVLGGTFRDDFRIDPGTGDVVSGVLDLTVDENRIAWVDEGGFHPDFLAFGAALLPDRLPLPTEDVAYLDLRDDMGELRVQTEETADGLRLFTAEGAVLPLVIPALDVEGRGAPVVEVTLDVTLAAGHDLIVHSGQILALVDPELDPAFDLSRVGIPVRLTELRYADPEGDGHGWAVLGQPVILGEPVDGGSAVLALSQPAPAGSVRLTGLVDLPYADTIPLVPGSEALVFGHDRLTGGFDVALEDGSGRWSLILDGGLTLDLDQSGGVVLDGELEAGPGGVSFRSLEVDPTAPAVFFDAGSLELGLSEISIPWLSWNDGDGWDFELLADLALRFPTLGDLVTGTLDQVRFTPEGVLIPATTVTEFGDGFDLAGFRAQLTALRLPEVRIDVFGAGVDIPWAPTADLTLGLSDEGAAAVPQLANLELSILNAGWGPDGFTGTIEPRTLLNPLDVPLGSEGTALALERFGGEVTAAPTGQAVNLRTGGSLRLPGFLRCDQDPGASVPVPQADLELFPDGGFGGRIQDVGVNCPVQLGPVEVAASDTDLVFVSVDTEVQTDAGPRRVAVQQVNLDTRGTVTLPGTRPGTEITASGRGIVQLADQGSGAGLSIAINDPFVWQVPAADPLLTLQVNRAVLDRRGLMLEGAGNVRLPDGTAGPTVDFSGFTIGRSGRPEAGAAAIRAGLTLDGALQGSTLAWSVADTSAAFSGDGVRLNLQGDVTVNRFGVGLGGAASADVAFNGTSLASLGVNFREGFTLDAVEARVRAGRADFLDSQSTVAYVTPQGFFPGDLFGVVPLPARIPLPTEEVAYLQVVDPATGQPLVETNTGTDGVELSTRSNASVALVLPGIPDATGDATRIPVQFTVTANPATWAISSGAIEAVAPAGTSLFELDGLGVPASVTRVSYSSASGTGPLLDARIRLPASLADLEVALDGLTVAADGIRGQALAGTLDPAAAPTGPLASATLGALDARLDGARVVFGGGGRTPSVTLDGGLTAGLFTAADGSAPEIGLEGTLGSDGAIRLAADISELPGSTLPLGQAEFELVDLQASPAVEVTATEQRFALGFTGVLTLPNLAPGFALTLAGLEVGTDGVTLPAISADTDLDGQGVELFGATFTLRDGVAGPAAALALDQDVLVATLNGDVSFLGTTVAFQGLQVGTNGRLAMAAAELAAGPVVMVPEVLTLDRLAVDQSRLAADFSIDLPAPFDGTGTQTASVRIGADGTVAGGGTLALIDEAPGLGPDRTTIDGGVATAHLRYLGLRLTPGLANPGSVEAVGDFYLAGESGNRITLGSRSNNAVDPGLAIGLDGSVRWGTLGVPSAFDFDFDVVRLNVRNVTVASSSDTGLTIGMGGSLGVAVPVLSGGLDFSGVGLTTGLDLDFSGASVQSGELKIAGVVGIAVSGFQYSSTPTTIEDVRGGLIPKEAGDGLPAGETASIPVSSVLRFGGNLSIGACDAQGPGCLVSGGVEDFLFYRTPASQGGLTNLVVQGAALDIPGFSVDADLRYRELDRSGAFEMVLGGEATVNQQTFGMVGAFEKPPAEEDLRAGLFLLTEQDIQVIPVLLVVSRVGGGFFYNPRPIYCTLVREAANVSTSTGGCGQSQTFAGFLYGQAAVVEPGVGRADVLMTATEDKLRLDGNIALLAPANVAVADAQISGVVEAEVGLSDLYMDGSVTLNVNAAPFLTAGPRGDMGKLELYLYGQEEWGIVGSSSVQFMNLLTGDAEVFVGPPGFLARGSLEGGFDVSIVKAEGSADVAAWIDGGGWNAFVETRARAEILGGALWAEARLRGARVSPEGSPVMVYLAGRGEGCVASLCGSEEVWVKFTDGSVSGGLGSNAVFDAIIAEAQAVRDEFEAARNAALGILTGAQALESLALSDQELADIYANLKENPALRAEIETAIIAEENAYPAEVDDSGWAAEQAWLTEYRDLLFQEGSPEDVQTPRLDTYYADVSAGVTRLQANRTGVDLRLQQALTEIGDLQSVAAGGEVSPSPIVQADFSRPQATLNPDGSKSLVSGPTVVVDQAAAAQVRSELQAREASTAAYVADLERRIDEMEAGLLWLDFLMLDTTNNAPLGWAGDYADVLTDVQEQFARHGDLLLRQQDWLRQERNGLVGRASTLDQLLATKNQALIAQADDPDQALANLVSLRANTLTALGSASTLGDDFLNSVNVVTDPSQLTVTELAQAATTSGRDLWYRLAEVGMLAADSAASGALADLRATARNELADRWLAHRSFTNRLREIYLARADLMAALLDLYTEYRRVYPDVTTVRTGSAMNGLSTSAALTTANATTATTVALSERIRDVLDIESRITELQQAQQVASIDGVRVVSRNRGYMAEEHFEITASHPTGVFEYLYNSRPGDGAGLSSTALLQSNGERSSRTQYVLTPGRGTTGQDRILRVGARGGAGYMAAARSTYTTRFEGGALTGFVPPAQFDEDVDVTPPPAPAVRIGGAHPAIDTVWTSSSELLRDVVWTVDDPESGIARYEYAVGTADDPTSQVGWTDVGGRNGMDIPGLDLQPRVWLGDSVGYRVSVRATNGAGLVGPVGRSAPILVDRTPPTFPQPSFILLPPRFELGGIASGPGDPVFAAAYDVCGAQPPADPGFAVHTYASRVPPRMEFLLPAANDLQSGVAAVAWTVAGDSVDTYGEAGWTRVEGVPGSLVIEGDPLAYGTTQTLSVVALDRAGVPSEPLHRSFRVPDPTDPVGAEFCAAPSDRPDRLRLRVRSGGVDPETGITGWDVRVRRADGTVLVPFPDQPNTGELADGAVLETPVFPVNDGDRVYGEIRVHNAEGGTTVRASGPFTMDLTPPTAPAAISATARQGRNETTVTLQYRTAAETGLTHHWYLLDPSGKTTGLEGTLQGTWSAWKSATLGLQSAPGQPLPAGTYTLALVSRTNTGLSSTTTQIQVVVP